MAGIWVLAGTNGAGKSSVGGEILRRSGGDYFNPDEVAKVLRSKYPSWTARQANIAAWEAGVRLLDDAIREGREHFFETTLGGGTITARLESAIDAGFEVRIWYVGLASVELHLARVAQRVARGGHDIPEADIRRRFDNSRRNLIRLTPRLTELKLFDNSAEAEVRATTLPEPRLLLHLRGDQVFDLAEPATIPEWAKPLIAAALRRQLG
jgi:predicted ABC-type ATPase